MDEITRGGLLVRLARQEGELSTAVRDYDALPAHSTQAQIELSAAKVDAASGAVEQTKKQLEELGRDSASAATPRISVSEPEIYGPGGRRFLSDLFAAQVLGDSPAHERIARHHRFEVERYAARGVDVEQFATSTGTLGGVIPPQYLVGLYAKASRNGRVFADQCNHQELPPEGMSLIVPLLTQGVAAAVQASESSAVTTQDPTESDLTVPVRTIGGYVPVSRQTLERGAYSEAILFEDLIARYWATLDTQCLNGSGSSGQLLGALNTTSVKTSSVTTQTVAGAWPKFADVIQQINTATGGLGYVADKIVVHPRRWGFISAALDSQGRPLLGINGMPSFNAVAEGDAAGYGQVGHLFGLPVYTDANLPTNLGSGTNEDWAVVMASRIVHLWEADGGRPVTLRFEQQAGTSLQTQLVAYGYAAFTAGRYPAAVGVVKGMTAPTF